MKKPRIKAFDSSHPIWEDVRDWMIERYATTGVFFERYNNAAHCNTCGWQGSYTAYENHRYVCPACGEKHYRQYSHPNYAGALIIDKKSDILIFRFIGFKHQHTAMGPSFEAYEILRIYTDEKEYEIQKSSGSTFKKCDYTSLIGCPELAEKDIYPYHTYDANLHGNPFVESLDILFEEVPLSKVYETIAQNAATNNIAKTCPKFAKPLPNTTEVLNTNYTVSIAENHVDIRRQGNAAQVDAWCGTCGTHASKTFHLNQTFLTVECPRCGSKMNASSQRNSSSTNGIGKQNLIIDVQQDKQCTTLRYCAFTVRKSVITPTVIGVKAELTATAELQSVYYVCCFADGEVTVFDKDGNPITYMEESNIIFANICLNPDVYETIKDDEFVKQTGYIDYIDKENDYSFQYFLGYMRSEVAKELVSHNLHGLIADIAKRSVTLPAYL
jgi:Zn finger protein HypA/HybF involved in hydrogenase expression